MTLQPSGGGKSHKSHKFISVSRPSLSGRPRQVCMRGAEKMKSGKSQAPRSTGKARVDSLRRLAQFLLLVANLALINPVSKGSAQPGRQVFLVKGQLEEAMVQRPKPFSSNSCNGCKVKVKIPERAKVWPKAAERVAAGRWHR